MLEAIDQIRSIFRFFKKRKLKAIPNTKSIAFGMPKVTEALNLLRQENYEVLSQFYHSLRNDEKSLLLDGLTADKERVNLLYRWHSQEPERWLPNLFAGVAYTHDAWEIRSTAHAEQVSQEQFSGFFAELEQADIALTRALSLEANEPEIYARLMQVNLGLQNREKIESLFAQLTALDPHHLEGHLIMVNALAPKWFGSFEEMQAFAAPFERPQKDDLRYAIFLRFATQHFVDMAYEDENKALKIFKKTYRRSIKNAYAQFDIPNISSLHRYYLHNYFSYAFHMMGEKKLRDKEIDLLGNHLSFLPWAYEEVEGERDLKMIKFS